MQDDDKGPLSSAELEGDARRAGASLHPEDAPGHTLPASESQAEPDESGQGPSPIAGTMLPPD